jgi:hypothetical protein
MNRRKGKEKRNSLINNNFIFMSAGLELEINELTVFINAKEQDDYQDQVIQGPALIERSLFHEVQNIVFALEVVYNFKHKDNDKTEDQVCLVDRDIAQDRQECVHRIVSAEDEPGKIAQGGRNPASDVNGLFDIICAEKDPGESDQAVGDHYLAQGIQPGNAGDAG